MKKEVLFSVDIETDGPIPGEFSMMSLAAVVVLDGVTEDTFTINLAPIPGAHQSLDTMQWWAKLPKAFAAATVDQVEPQEAMKRFSAWVGDMAKKHDGSPTFLAYPAGFDFTFVYWYLIKYIGSSPFGFSCLDMKTYAAAIIGKPLRETAKRSMPKEWFEGLPPHTHVALDDAIEQAQLFVNMRKWAEGEL